MTAQLPMFEPPRDANPERVRQLRDFATAETRRHAHAAQAAQKKQATWGRIMDFARGRGESGFTADELAASWQCSPNHTAPRICELVKLGKLKAVGHRDTRYGRPAAVLVVAE